MRLVKNTNLGVKGNKISRHFRYISDTKSILEHEKFHQDNFKDPSFESTLMMHIRVYIKGIKTDNFKNASEDYQNGTINSLANYFSNARYKIISSMIY